MFEMRDVGPPVFDLDIKKLEKKLRVKLPEDYKDFLKRNNGGRPDPKFFPIGGFKNNPIGQVLDFFEINGLYNPCSIDWNYDVYQSRMPKGFMPIACEDGGNIICLVISGNKAGRVYYWNHDEETSPPAFENVYLIAESFQAFLDSIHFVDISTL